MQEKGARVLFLNPEQAVVGESHSAHRGQRGHSLSQHDPGPAAQVRGTLGLRTTPSTPTAPVMMVGKMERQAGALAEPGDTWISSRRRGRPPAPPVWAGTILFCTTAALPSSGQAWR